MFSFNENLVLLGYRQALTPVVNVAAGQVRILFFSSILLAVELFYLVESRRKLRGEGSTRIGDNVDDYIIKFVEIICAAKEFLDVTARDFVYV